MRGPVLVTGAAGFIGGHVTRRLLESGVAVHALVRDPSALAPEVRGRVRIVRADLRDGAALRQAVRAAPTVLHLAACARVWTRHPAEFRAVNVEAVATLLDAVREAGTEKLVHVSTVLALPPHRPAPVPAALRAPTPYEATKAEGERLVASAARAGLPATVVRPTRVFGPGPLHDANSVSRLIALYLAGRFRVRLDDGGALANWVHVADVADGILLAAERGGAGDAYVLGGENASLETFLKLVSGISGVRRRVFRLAPALGLAAGRAAEWWGALGGRAPLTAGWVRIFLEDRRADIAPAREALGYRPRPLAAGLSETIAWLTQSLGRAAA